MFYKILKDENIVSIGQCTLLNSIATEITKEKYKQLSNLMKTKPDDTLEFIYRLSDKVESYVPYERTHDETVDWYVQKVDRGEITLEDVPKDYQEEVAAKLPTEETKYTLDEAATLLAQEVSQ